MGRVDLGEQVAGLDGLPVLKGDALEQAVDPRLDGDGVEGRDRADGVEADVDVARPAGGGGEDGHRAIGGVAVAPARAASAAFRCGRLFGGAASGPAGCENNAPPHGGGGEQGEGGPDVRLFHGVRIQDKARCRAVPGAGSVPN